MKPFYFVGFLKRYSINGDIISYGISMYVLKTFKYSIAYVYHISINSDIISYGIFNVRKRF